MASVPSPIVMLSAIAVAMASITFFATRHEEPTERRVDQATVASAEPTTPAPEATPPATKKPRPKVDRAEVYVEVFNNSGIRGLAARTAAKATEVGWQVVGEDNWYGAIPASTVYYPARLKAAGKQLALDLGLRRSAPAVAPMKMDRLTVVLTADAAG